MRTSSTVPRGPRINPQYACFRMKLAPSKIHRWGVYASEFIPAGRKVIEYTGERINRRETKRRADLSKFTYLFTLDAYWTLMAPPAAQAQSTSITPASRTWSARILKGHILYMSLRDIRPGEELTVDYRFEKKVEKVRCRCGAPGAAARSTFSDDVMVRK